MASRFTQGASEGVTRTITKKAVDPRPGMHGMPGYVKTGQDASSGALTGGSGMGPKREGPIGKKGGSGSPNMDAAKFRGSSDKSYRATSTGPGGTMKGDTAIGSKGGSNRGGSSSEGPARGKPTSGAPMYGGTAASPGGRGKMESMRGRAKTSWEK